MKKLLIILSINLTANAFSLTISGASDVNGEKLDELHVSGYTKAKNISVKNATTISGRAEISDSELNNLHISGSAQIINSQISGKASISGTLVVNHSQFLTGNISCSGMLKSSNNLYNAPIKLSGSINSYQDAFNDILNTSGRIDANNSIFNQQITVDSQKNTWVNSQINTNIVDTYEDNRPWIISIFSNKSSAVPEILLNNTTVRGNIEFTKIKGVVVLIGDAKILGRIKNADIKHL